MSGYATCSRCSKRILWCRTRSGKKVPLDIDSDPLRGKWRIERKDDGKSYVCYPRDNRHADAILFACHHDTCERMPGPVRHIDPATMNKRSPESE